MGRRRVVSAGPQPGHEAAPVKLIRGLLWALLVEAGLVGLVVVCVRTAGTDDAWKVGVLLVASLPLVGFATRERR
jgi:hypothetical protein